MQLPSNDITYITEQVNLLYDEIILVWDISLTDNKKKKSPDILHTEIVKLLNVINDAHTANEKRLSVEIADNRKQVDLQELGDYGIQLLSELSDWAFQLNLPDTARQFELLTFPFAIVNARLNIEINELEAPVNAISYLANNISDLKELSLLYRGINELISAIPPAITEDMQSCDPSRPWRILLLNRGIVATRTLQIDLMEPAFDSIVENLPEDSAMFFEQGMEQMDIIGYPQEVSDIMRRYHQLHQTKRTLH